MDYTSHHMAGCSPAGWVSVSGESVSVIIPCHNPDAGLLEAIASVRAQEHGAVELVIVDDGSTDPESGAILRQAARLADRYVEQDRRGVSAARNAGARAASGAFLAPLDCQDLLRPDFVRRCLAALRETDAAFAYGDYRVFGVQNYLERLPAYNLYDLLERNIVSYAVLLRAEAFHAAGGYDEALFAYEDWELWLRLGATGRYGVHLDRVLWSYRKQGRSLSDEGREHHAELVQQIREKHPELYGDEGRARVKRRWRPSVCVVGAAPEGTLPILDWEAIEPGETGQALHRSRAAVFLYPAAGRAPEPQSLELAALASLHEGRSTALPDGSVAVPRKAMRRFLRRGPGNAAEHAAAPWDPASLPYAGRWLEHAWRHLYNAELLRLESWTRHPVRSAARLIPLRWKEAANRRAGRAIFDLSFYLRFQPQALLQGEALIRTADYVARVDPGRPRVALVTPHLGVGGAEAVLLEIAAALGRERYEILVLATDSRDDRWRDRWEACAEQVFDLRRLGADHTGAAVLSIVRNRKCDALVVQNTLHGYDVLPLVRQAAPEIRMFDLVHHAAGAGWSIVACTAAVAEHLDARIVVSGRDRAELVARGTPEERVALIRNGVDLERFHPRNAVEARPYRVVFAGRLDPVKRPELLPEIARELRALRPEEDFRMVVAGDGREAAPLRSAAARSGVAHLFEFLGHVAEIAPVLAEAAVVLLPSRSEGVPLVVLEAFACGKPVVAARVGAVGEVVDEATGILIEGGEGEAAAFARAIAALLADPQRRRDLGRAARRRVEDRHDRQRSLEQYRALFDTALRDARCAARSAPAATGR